MGRYIDCLVNGELKTVWKYVFGVQASEMGRIYHELGLGDYKYIISKEYETDNSGKTINTIYEYSKEMNYIMGDELTLTREDLKELNDWIEILKNENKDQWYIAMLEAIRNFMFEHPEQQKFIFEGEF
jgi:ADP-dependent phosphofructokinase/glucokinase